MKPCVSVLCAVAVLAGLSPKAVARVPSLAALVPADAIAYVATPDLAQFDRQWSATSFARLWQSNDFAEFRSSFHKATRLTVQSDLSLLGVTWQQLLTVASGEACCAIAPVGDDVGLLLLVDVSKHADDAEKLIAQLRQQAPSRIYFLADGVLGVTNRQELAKTPAENLALVESFAAISKETRSSSAQVTWFVDPWAFQPSETWKQLAENGFKVVQAAGGAMTFATEQHDLEHRWCVYAPGKREKAARLLNFSPLEDWSLPAWIPADMDSILSIQWNLGGSLPGCGSLFDATYAEGEEGTFDAVLEDIKLEPKGPKVDIPELLKLQVGPVLSLTNTLNDGTTAAVYAVKVKDEVKVAGALERMFAPDEGVDRKQVGKYTMWVFDDTKADPNASPAMGPDLAGYALAAARDYLYVATSAAALERLLVNAPRPALVDDPTYKELRAQAEKLRRPTTIGWRAALIAAGLRPMYEGLRGGEVDLGRLLGDPESPEHRLDLAKLPAGEILPKFIAAGFGLVNQNEDGWLFQGYVEKGSK